MDSAVTETLSRFESRLQKWLTRKQSKYLDSSRLTRKHIFIIPTRAGLCLGALLFIMLLTSLNYMNSMAMLFTFFVSGTAFISAWFTHLNLADLVVSRVPQTHCFVDESGFFKVLVKNPTNRDRFGVIFRERNDNLILNDIPANKELLVKMPITPTRRGEFKLRRFAIATRMPMGLFNAWSWQTLRTSLWAYPTPIANYPAPLLSSGEEGDHNAREQKGEEFSNLRDYSQGDPIKHIAWKQQARHQKLLIKEFNETAGNTSIYSWDAIDNVDDETRLSYLCFWVMQASKQQHTFGLELPGISIPLNSGENHTASCLMALAKYGAQ